MSDNSCFKCNNVSGGRQLKNFIQCTESKRDAQGNSETIKRCVPVLINDQLKYKWGPREAPFRVQFPDEDSCKKAILLPGLGIDCIEVKNRLNSIKQYQTGEVDDCFNCVPQKHMLLRRCRENPTAEECKTNIENYSCCGSKKGTYLSLENCWQNQQNFQL
jgi:hypothetical protein